MFHSREHKCFPKGLNFLCYAITKKPWKSYIIYIFNKILLNNGIDILMTLEIDKKLRKFMFMIRMLLKYLTNLENFWNH